MILNKTLFISHLARHKFMTYDFPDHLVLGNIHQSYKTSRLEVPVHRQPQTF